MHHIRVPRLWPLLVVTALLLAGCQYYRQYLSGPRNPPPAPLCDELAQQEESPDNIPFETIATGRDSLWRNEKPGLFVLTAPEDISEIEQYFTEKWAAVLQAVDFDSSTVIAVFSGVKSEGGWGFCITSINQQENEDKVLLHTHLVDSPIKPAAEESYYYLIHLPREKLPSGEIAFYLALTRHLYVSPTGRQQVIETSEEEIVSTSTRSLP